MELSWKVTGSKLLSVAQSFDEFKNLTPAGSIESVFRIFSAEQLPIATFSDKTLTEEKPEKKKCCCTIT